MVVIRLLRVGRRNQPAFKIVVCDRRNPSTGGKVLEHVGFYSPQTKEKVLKGERIKYWLSVGAQPSDTVYNLLIENKIISGGKRPIKIKKKKQEKKEEVKQGEQKPSGSTESTPKS